MLRLRARLASVVGQACASRGILSLVARLPRPLQHLTVLTWHRVANDIGAGFDPGVVDASPMQFDRQVTILKESFSIIGISDLMRHQVERSPLPPNPALLTFDDAYRESLTVVLPILKKHDAKAVFFIPTGYMEERRLFSWELIYLMLKRCRRSQISITYPPLSFELTDEPSRLKAANALSHASRSYPSLDWKKFFAELAAACEVDVDAKAERAMADELILDWSGVQQLVAAGMDVQSHGHSHSLYPYISPEAVLADATCSRKLLEDKTGVAQTAFSWPAGAYCESGTAGYASLKQAGYKLGFCNDAGASRLGFISDWLLLSRLPAEPSWDESQYRAILTFPNALSY